MFQSKNRLRPAWGLLLVALLSLLLISTPASASQRPPAAAPAASSTPVNATIYLTTDTLRPIFQQQITQQVPNTVNSTINGMVSTLPATDRGWATLMAKALLQPSATLVKLSPQSGGIATTIRMNLYPGDPKPITADLLVTFSILDATTIQVSAQPQKGSPTLINGPLAKLPISLGQLQNIRVTPTCGDAALALNLKIPVMLAQAPQSTTTTATHLSNIRPQPVKRAAHVATETSSYVELPASSLAAIGSSIGSLPIDDNLSARNIQVGVQGNRMVITSDIVFGDALLLGRATTYAEPLARQGGLAIRIINTTLTIFSLFTFPNNAYNRQIEQTLNAKLNGAFAGKFTVARAAIGTNAHIPCAARNSLILTGTTTLPTA
jgi:hypothetical protein